MPISFPLTAKRNAYRVVEVVIGAMGIEWAVWLLVFHSYSISPVLAILREWQVPELLMIVWPALAGVGLLYLPKPWRRQLHLVMCSFWVFVAVGISYNNVALTAVPVYGTIGILHAVMYGLTNDGH